MAPFALTNICLPLTADGAASPLRANRFDVIGVKRIWLTLYLDYYWRSWARRPKGCALRSVPPNVAKPLRRSARTRRFTWGAGSDGGSGAGSDSVSIAVAPAAAGISSVSDVSASIEKRLGRTSGIS